MAGFPARPHDSDFGPALVDTRPVRDETREASSRRLNLRQHQIAGMGLVGPLAWVRYAILGGPVVSLLRHAEAWNPSAASGAPFTAPVLVRTGVGIVEIEWAATYPDETGALVSPGITDAYAFGAGLTFLGDAGVHAHVEVLTVRKVRCRTFDFAQAPVDRGALVFVM